MAFLFTSPVSAEIVLDDADTRAKVVIPVGKRTDTLYRFVGNEDVRGKVILRLKDAGKKLEHSGVRIELIGQIDLSNDRGNHFQFTSLQIDLLAPGFLEEREVALPFAFEKPDKQCESYNGTNVRLRYYLKVTVARSFLQTVTKEMDLWVTNYSKPPEKNDPIKFEVGIEDCLHIEFEYAKSKYDLKGVVIGKVFFILVRIKIVHMEIRLLRRETIGQAPNLYVENETLCKYELMDGAPVKAESIPIRLFLGNIDLTPTYRNVHSKFNVKYFLNLILIDEDGRRYFKQQEIALWRRSPDAIATDAPAALAQIPKHIPDRPKEDKTDKKAKKKAYKGSSSSSTYSVQKTPTEDPK